VPLLCILCILVKKMDVTSPSPPLPSLAPSEIMTDKFDKKGPVRGNPTYLREQMRKPKQHRNTPCSPPHVRLRQKSEDWAPIGSLIEPTQCLNLQQEMGVLRFPTNNALMRGAILTEGPDSERGQQGKSTAGAKSNSRGENLTNQNLH